MKEKILLGVATINTGSRITEAEIYSDGTYTVTTGTEEEGRLSAYQVSVAQALLRRSERIQKLQEAAADVVPTVGGQNPPEPYEEDMGLYTEDDFRIPSPDDVIEGFDSVQQTENINQENPVPADAEEETENVEDKPKKRGLFHKKDKSEKLTRKERKEKRKAEKAEKAAQKKNKTSDTLTLVQPPVQPTINPEPALASESEPQMPVPEHEPIVNTETPAVPDVSEPVNDAGSHAEPDPAPTPDEVKEETLAPANNENPEQEKDVSEKARHPDDDKKKKISKNPPFIAYVVVACIILAIVSVVYGYINSVIDHKEQENEGAGTGVVETVPTPTPEVPSTSTEVHIDLNIHAMEGSEVSGSTDVDVSTSEPTPSPIPNTEPSGEEV